MLQKIIQIFPILKNNSLVDFIFLFYSLPVHPSRNKQKLQVLYLRIDLAVRLMVNNSAALSPLGAQISVSEIIVKRICEGKLGAI